MEISNEIKAKVFAQYLGQPMKCVTGVFHANSNSMKDGVMIMSLSVMADCYEGTFKWSDFVLILKPLRDVSDEDAIEVAKIFEPNANDNNIKSALQFKNGIAEIFNGVYEKFDLICPNASAMAYQFLQSKGYDLPQYLLGGKTLKESGLAIYETN